MSFMNQEPQLRKHSDMTAINQQYSKELELDQYFEEFQPPALQKFQSIISEQDHLYIDKVQNTSGFEQEQENCENNSQVENKLQTSYLQQFEQNNSNIQNNNNKQKRYRRITHYNEFFDKDYDEQQFKNSPCRCSKSHCLLLYCTCLHRNQECTELCQCVDCHNNQDYSQIRQQALEKVKIKQQRQKHDDDLFDKTTIWGCQCKKSQCKKNYCECFIRNRKCSSLCKCTNCENKKRIPKQKTKINKCQH